MKKFTFIILVFISIQISAQTAADSTLKILQNKFDLINNLSSNIKQLLNGKENLSGSFFFKKKNNLRIELGKITIVSNGKTVWNYNKKQNKVIISNYDESDPSILSMRNLIFDYPSKCAVTLVKSGTNSILVLIPGSTSELNFKEAKLWLNNDNLISKVVVDEMNDNSIEIDFSEYKLNIQIPNSKFTFSPPEGCKVIDLR